jgi:serine/threonine protein kinase
MDAQYFQRVKDIFAEAVDLTIGERAAFLRARCGDDQVLRDEIESLLDAHNEPENLIEANIINLQENLTASVKNYDGKVFGHYTILREIGNGGMGAVFLAARNDGEFDQQVALKIIRQTVISRDLERHFRRERQILASLNHPNIAKLLDGGVSAAGEPFLAMEYIDGVDLIEFARDLSITEKLRLFLKICDALESAHRNLVAHLDIKPSNILVTKQGEPKLLDFGLAKMQDESFSAEVTQTIFRAFTPTYASPEQLNGSAVSTSSDIYSLGVVFYELLGGQKPFHLENKSLEEILRTITNEEPRRLGQLENGKSPTPKLKGDLENIASMALRKEPERRYRSVGDFAGDIGKYLDGLPISARPNTFYYRASKFFRRNRLAVSAAALIVVALITGLSLALWQADVARVERDRAQKRFGDVRKLSSSLLFEITPKIENLNGSTEAREILVRSALEYLDSLASESRDDLQLRSELASAYEKIGDLQGNPNKSNLSDFSGAIESYRKANEIRYELPDSDENLSLLAKNFIQLSTVRYYQNDIKGAVSDSVQSLEIYEKLIARSDSYQLQTDRIEAQISNAQIYADNNQYKTAIPLFQRTLQEIERYDQNKKEVRLLRVKADSFLAHALSWDGRQSEAETEISETIDWAENLLAEFPNDPVIRQQVWRTFSLASIIYEGVDNKFSFNYGERALELAKAGVAADNADAQAKQNLMKSYSRIGFISVLTGRMTGAENYLKKAEEILSELSTREPKNIGYQKDYGRLYIRFGDMYKRQMNLLKALESYERSAQYFEAIAEAEDKNTLAKRDMAQSLKNVGETELKLHRVTEARQTFQKALDILMLLKSENALGEFDLKMIDDVKQRLSILLE